MKQAKQLLSIGLILLSASSLTGHASVTVRGAVACSDWTRLRAEDKKNGTTNAARLWLLGYLSGLSAAANKELWMAPGNSPSLTVEALYTWVDAYCRNHPLNGLDAAADSFYLERRQILDQSDSHPPKVSGVPL